jgi:hypothetical protein
LFESLACRLILGGGGGVDPALDTGTVARQPAREAIASRYGIHVTAARSEVLEALAHDGPVEATRGCLWSADAEVFGGRHR